MFAASGRSAKHLNICRGPSAIISCDDGTSKTQKHCNFSFNHQAVFWLTITDRLKIKFKTWNWAYSLAKLFHVLWYCRVGKSLRGHAALSPHMRTWLSSITELYSSPHIPKQLWNSFIDNVLRKGKSGVLQHDLCGHSAFTSLEPIAAWREGRLWGTPRMPTTTS